MSQKFNIFTLINEIKHTNGIKIDTTSDKIKLLHDFLSEWDLDRACLALDKLKRFLKDKYQIKQTSNILNFKGLAKTIYQIAIQYNLLICDCVSCQKKHLNMSIVFICMLYMCIYENIENDNFIKIILNDLIEIKECITQKYNYPYLN